MSENRLNRRKQVQAEKNLMLAKEMWASLPRPLQNYD